MYAYVLALYYNNDKLIPKSVNQGMEFEYALAKNAFNKIAKIGATYITKEPPEYPKDVWKTFQASAEFDELSKILNLDYKVLQTYIFVLTQSDPTNFKRGTKKL